MTALAYEPFELPATSADLTQHKWPFVLRDLVEKHGIVVPDPGTEHGRRLVRPLGAKIGGKSNAS